jgi:hypothetical protein
VFFEVEFRLGSGQKGAQAGKGRTLTVTDSSEDSSQNAIQLIGCGGS